MSNIDSQSLAALKAVISKSVNDAAFRARCLASAEEAGRELGVTLPAGVVFTETRDNNPASIVLPPFGADPDEIHDEVLLADVAGGLIDGQDSSYTNPVYGGPQCAL